jgi:ketosteroid isomerase-like protein
LPDALAGDVWEVRNGFVAAFGGDRPQPTHDQPAQEQPQFQEAAMSDLEDFLAHTLQRHAQATTGVRNGDATALIEMLSTRDPVTLFPAAQPAKRGWAEVSQAFQRVASLYSNSTPVTFDLVAAGVSGDLAYVVGYERGSASVGGGPVEPVDLRVTQVYRREDDEWKLVHRHGDPGHGGNPAVDHLRAELRNRSGDDVPT